MTDRKERTEADEPEKPLINHVHNGEKLVFIGEDKDAWIAIDPLDCVPEKGWR